MLIKKTFLHIISLLLITVCNAQKDSTEVWAWEYWKTRDGKDIILCKDVVNLNKKGFIITLSGCESNCSFTMDYYTLKGDTFLIRPYLFMDEPPFLEIKKTKSRKPIQNISFWCADDKWGYFSQDSMVRFFGSKGSQWPRADKNVFKIPRYMSAGMEIVPLSKTFNLPIVSWLDPKYDYKIKMNIPLYAFSLAQTCKKAKGIAGNLGLPYLLMRNNKIIFPDGHELPIERY
jgi:hypothetical protein